MTLAGPEKKPIRRLKQSVSSGLPWAFARPTAEQRRRNGAWLHGGEFIGCETASSRETRVASMRTVGRGSGAVKSIDCSAGFIVRTLAPLHQGCCRWTISTVRCNLGPENSAAHSAPVIDNTEPTMITAVLVSNRAFQKLGGSAADVTFTVQAWAGGSQ